MPNMKTKTLKLSPEVIDALRDSKYTVGVLTPPLRRLTKKGYSDYKKAVTVMEGVWQPGKNCFHFPFHVQVPKLLKQAIETGEVTDRVQTFQEFLTPPVLANRMAALLVDHLRSCTMTSDVVKVLEPSAGKGALVEAVLHADALWSWFITAIEIQRDNCCAIQPCESVTRINVDFLRAMPDAVRAQDAVIMNPPFDHKAWVKHVEHACDFVKERGVLISVVPATARITDFRRPKVMNSDEAYITPVSFRFDKTNVKVAVLTIGIPAKLVDKFFPAQFEETPLPKRVTVMSLDKCLSGLRKSVTAITHELDAIEDILHE